MPKQGHVMKLSEQQFLDQLVATGQVCNVFLSSGVKIVGAIAAHSGGGDVLWMDLQRTGGTELAMLFIHNISTICPIGSRQLNRKASREIEDLLSVSD
jgi:sRNA-binding regulator protein Hfq